MPGYQIDGISKDQLDNIHHASIKILKNLGIKIESEEAAEIFHSAGSEIVKKRDGFIVKVLPSIVARHPQNPNCYVGSSNLL